MKAKLNILRRFIFLWQVEESDKELEEDEEEEELDDGEDEEQEDGEDEELEDGENEDDSLSEYEDEEDHEDGTMEINFKNLPKDLQGTVQQPPKNIGGESEIESEEEEDDGVDTFANSNRVQEKMKGEVTKVQLGILLCLETSLKQVL